LVIATQKSGIYIFDEKTFKQYSANYGMSNEYTSVYVDSASNIWLSIWNFGIAKLNFNTNRYTYFDSYSGIKTLGIYAVYADNGICWIGTNNAGVMRYNGDEIFHISSNYGLPSDYITHITKDKNDNLWFASNSAGIFKFDGENFYQYSTKEGFIHYNCTSIYPTKDNSIWVSTYGGGVCMLKDNKIYWYSTKDGLATNNIRWITADNNNNIWFAYAGEGIAKFDGKKIYEYTIEQGLPHNDVRNIICDHENNIWFTTWDGGMAKFDGVNFYHYNNVNSINTNVTSCLFLDKENNVWLGTEGGGLSKISNNRILHLTTKEGLSNDMITGITQSDNGNIWVTTINGINLIEQENNNYKIKQFGLNDGLNGLSFYHNSIFYDNKIVLAGSEKNLTLINENLLNKKNEPPQVYLSDLLVNHTIPDWDSLIQKKEIQISNFYKWTDLPIKPTFKYTCNNLTFIFHAISWGNEHHIKYRYMLNTVDMTWHPAGKNNEAGYNNLPPGEHTFYVQASIDGINWSESAVYNFIISPPWWQTWLFRVIAICFGLFLILMIFRWRTATLRKRQRELEKIVRERTQEILYQKEELVKQKNELEIQKEIVEEKNREILDSINYAKRLQEAILPPLKLVKQELEQSFIIYKPKDIVAGDFYWMHTIEKNAQKKIIFAAADCTGHGVPGAMVSVVCSNALNRTVKEFGITTPGNILDKVRELVLETFEKSENEVKDGMDISICALTPGNNNHEYNLEWAGANNPLWLIPNNASEIIEFNGDKQPIGKNDNPKPFSTHNIKLKKGDTLYIFTDGYADQFGGDKGKKLKSSNFKKLLLSIQNEKFEKHREIINSAFDKWKGDLEQVDDVCIIGVRI
jgi:serine phosphatase RsbU (regulator of sigma subunit)/streptogramin lyase